VPETTTTVAQLSSRLLAMEEALRRSERLSIASRYAGAIMHEVNNPLEALSNLVYLAKHSPNDAAQISRYMEIAESQLVRLGDITRKTLSFYKDQAQEKEFDLVDIAESALTIHSQRTSQQRVEIRKRVSGPTMARVFAGEILQVLSNLFLNSLDSLPQEGAILYLRLKATEHHVHITISDNGTGIDPAIYANMFEPHHTTKENGTGFGLWLSRNIVHRHQGKISCRTSRVPGKTGTTFRLTFPKSQAVRSPMAQA
jgi:signal transduction histidine kinase